MGGGLELAVAGLQSSAAGLAGCNGNGGGGGGRSVGLSPGGLPRADRQRRRRSVLRSHPHGQRSQGYSELVLAIRRRGVCKDCCRHEEGSGGRPKYRRILVCLECGRHSCGDSRSYLPYGHAWDHARQEQQGRRAVRRSTDWILLQVRV